MARSTLMSALAALAAAAVAVASNVPTQVHIAYAGATPGSGMAVSWVTGAPTTTTTVRYGTSPTGLATNVTGTTALDYEVWVHHVVLTGLTPATTYYYTAGDAAGGWSSVTAFKTAPAAGAEFPAAVAVFGDMGIWGYSNATFADLARLGGAVDFMYLVGDGSYADDDFLHDPISPQYAATWDGWFTELQPFAATTPFMTLPGNHEAECHDLFVRATCWGGVGHRHVCHSTTTTHPTQPPHNSASPTRRCALPLPTFPRITRATACRPPSRAPRR